MKPILVFSVAVFAVLGSLPSRAQVKQTRDQILFYTSEWQRRPLPRRPPQAPRLPPQARQQT